MDFRNFNYSANSNLIESPTSGKDSSHRFNSFFPLTHSQTITKTEPYLLKTYFKNLKFPNHLNKCLHFYFNPHPINFNQNNSRENLLSNNLLYYLHPNLGLLTLTELYFPFLLLCS
jgi:hypothetical protein